VYPKIARFSHWLVQKARGWDYEEELSSLMESQKEKKEERELVRLKAVKDLLKHCSLNVPYYRDSWRDISFSPDDVTLESGLGILPILTKDNLRGHYKFFSSNNKIPYDVWKSSGSTGEPFPFVLDNNSIKYNTFAALARGKKWWGWKPGEPEAMIWSGVSDASGTLKGRLQALKRRISWGLQGIVLIDVYKLDSSSIAEGYKKLMKHQPKLIRGISSGLYRFCVGLSSLGLDGHKLNVSVVIYTGEGLPESQKAFIEQIFGCPVVCEYGCTELGIIGFECPERKIHLSDENLFCEFIKDGKPAKPGEVAELVVTNMRNYAFPLVRYSVGDLVVPSEDVCKCGRTLPLIDGIQGRLHDAIISPDGTVIHALFFTHLFDRYENVHQFRVVQEADYDLNIELVSRGKLNTVVIDDIRGLVDAKLGNKVSVSVAQVESLPVSERGKTPWIISKLNQSS